MHNHTVQSRKAKDQGQIYETPIVFTIDNQLLRQMFETSLCCIVFGGSVRC